MSDVVATLHRLADACDACDHLAYSFTGGVTGCFLDQRQILADALPRRNWHEAAREFRAMAAEVDRLLATLDDAPPPADVEMLASANRALAAEVERLRAIPRGCLDYLGGYDGRDLDIYHHGIGTVIAAMDHAVTAPDFQTRVVEAIGSERRNARNLSALSGALSVLRDIAAGTSGAAAAREFLDWMEVSDV